MPPIHVTHLTIKSKCTEFWFLFQFDQTPTPTPTTTTNTEKGHVQDETSIMEQLLFWQEKDSSCNVCLNVFSTQSTTKYSFWVVQETIIILEYEKSIHVCITNQATHVRLIKKLV